jgi:hypothetical protein
MIALGLLITLAGFLITLLSLGMASATGVRMAMTLLGIAVSLFGIIGVLNPAYLKTAPWRR